MKIASIDLGTNTILLLIAEVDINNKIIFSTTGNWYKMPRIGKGLKPGEEINAGKVKVLFNVLDDYKKIISKHGCDLILANATNAFRIASNGEKIAKLVKKTFGFDINIIPGKKEAEYSFLGAYHSTKNRGTKLIIDIGGGSTEIIIGKPDNIKYSHSFQFGVVSLTERYRSADPLSPDNLHLIKKHVKKELDLIKNKFIIDEVISVAGTPTTLSAVKNGSKDYIESIIEGSVLTTSDLDNIINELNSYTSDEILQKYGSVMSGREDVIVTGAIILNTILQELNQYETIVSAKGLRYGAVNAYLAGL